MTSTVHNIIDVDDCALNPCENGATCTDQVDDYNSCCVGSWKGKNCDWITGELLFICLLDNDNQVIQCNCSKTCSFYWKRDSLSIWWNCQQYYLMVRHQVTKFQVILSYLRLNYNETMEIFFESTVNLGGKEMSPVRKRLFV